MEVGRILSLERLRERSLADDSRTPGRSQKKPSPTEESAPGLQAADSKPSGEFRSPINFAYLPSGRIQLNQDERNQLIDFFE